MGIANQKSKKKNHLVKSSWNLGKTGTIRIPLAIKEDLLEIARHLDENGKIDLKDSGEIFNIIKNDKTILSQDYIEKIISILNHGITPKKQGGVYNGNNASTLKKEVVKAIVILEEQLSNA